MIETLKRLWPRQQFARDIIKLSGATAFAQIIALTALPALTRIYTPDAYGLAATFSSIAGLISVISSLRYEFAIPLPRSDRGGWHVAIFALLVLIIAAVVSGLAAIYFDNEITDHLGLSPVAFALLLATSVATLGSYQVANYWAIRRSNFNAIAQTSLQQGIVGPGSQLAFGLVGFGALGLIIGQTLGQCAGILRLASAMIADNRRTGFFIHRRGIVWAIKRYRHFPLYDSWAGLLNVAGAQAPVLLFGALFSPAMAGYYALSQRALSAPLGLIGKAVSQALLPRIIKAGRSTEAAQTLEKLIRILAMASLPPFAIVALVAPSVVPVLFGEDWVAAGWVAAWTAMWVGWQFICSPLSIVLVAFEAQKLNTLLQAALLALRVSALVVGALYGTAGAALLAFSISSAVGYAGYTLATGLAAGLTARTVMMATLRPTLLSGFCYAILASNVAGGVPEYLYVLILCVLVLWIMGILRILRSNV